MASREVRGEWDRDMLTRGAVVVAVLLSLNSSDALADTWGNVHCDVATCDIGAGIGQQPGWDVVPGDPLAGGEDPFAGCRRVPVNGAPPPDAGETGGWFMVLCSPDGKDPLSHGPVWIVDSPDEPISPASLAQIARARLRLPSPGIAVNPAGDQLVNLPTWMWLSSGWTSTSATASVPGVSVTATAAASSVIWSMGDGSVVTCSGPGTPYTSGMDPKAPSPDCGHVYRRSSASQPEQAFPVTVTVRWAVSWSGAGQSGVFPDMSTSSTVGLRVAEAQALNNGG